MLRLSGGTESISWNRYSYRVPDMLGTNVSTNKKHKFYNSTVQAISRGGGDCATKVGALCTHFVEMEVREKTQVEIGSSKLFNSQGQTIDTSDQSIFP